MNSITKRVGISALSLSCLWAGSAVAADKASYQAAFDAAMASTEKAASIGFEWRDTRKLLRKAQASADKGDFAAAEKLANEAKFQGDTAYAQGLGQETAWKAAVVR